VLKSDSLADKTNALDLSAELKLSFLAGLLDISGSGKYLTDNCDQATKER
jgi:hypothetical protein